MALRPSLLDGHPRFAGHHVERLLKDPGMRVVVEPGHGKPPLQPVVNRRAGPRMEGRSNAHVVRRRYEIPNAVVER